MIPEDVRKNVRAVLLSKVGGVHMSRFLPDYKSLVQENLSFRELGFTSLKTFLEAMPEIARLDTSAGELSTKIFGVGEPDTYMPIFARKAQGKLPKNYLQNLKRSSAAEEEKSNTDMPKDELVPDGHGLYSVFMLKDRYPTYHVEEVQMLFGQAGTVVKCHETESLVFIRFATEKEVRRCVSLFEQDFGVRIANSNIKGTEEYRKRDDDYKQKAEIVENFKGEIGKAKDSRVRINKLHKMRGKNIENSDDDRTDMQSTCSFNTGRQKVKTAKLMVNGVNGHPNGNDDGEIQLFVGCLESEDVFNKLIEPFQPIVTKVFSKLVKKFAFLNVRSHERAQNIIKTLNGTVQPEGLKLFVGYDKKENISANNQVVHNGQKEINIPSLGVDYSEMCRLVPEREVKNAEKFDVDCSVFVGNFPSASFESTLRNIFKDFKVMDICIVNNNHELGCTKAFVYLPSVFEVARAIKTLHGKVPTETYLHLKVDVPNVNKIVKDIVTKILKMDLV